MVWAGLLRGDANADFMGAAGELGMANLQRWRSFLAPDDDGVDGKRICPARVMDPDSTFLANRAARRTAAWSPVVIGIEAESLGFEIKTLEGYPSSEAAYEHSAKTTAGNA